MYYYVSKVRVNKTSESTEIEFTYSPIGFGKLRLFIQFANALGSMQVCFKQHYMHI
jgi:hypothetical protein